MISLKRLFFGKPGGAGRISPWGFALLAVQIAVVFFVLHLLGFRESMSVLSGTIPNGGEGFYAVALKAALYLFFYMAATLVTPILLLAAAFFWTIGHFGVSSGVKSL